MKLQGVRLTHWAAVSPPRTDTDLYLCSTSSVVSARSTRLHRGGILWFRTSPTGPYYILPVLSAVTMLALPRSAKPGTTAALDDADSSCGFHGVSPLFSGRTLHVLDNFQLGYAYSELPDLQTTGRKKVPVAPDKEKAGASSAEFEAGAFRKDGDRSKGTQVKQPSTGGRKKKEKMSGDKAGVLRGICAEAVNKAAGV